VKYYGRKNKETGSHKKSKRTKTNHFEIMKSKANTGSNLWIIFIALGSILFHLAFYSNLEYHRDELLYFSLGQHPAFGYATVPPMIGWVAWLMKSIFGYSLFAVRIFPAILSGVLVIVVSGIAAELGGSMYARILAAIGTVIFGFGIRTFSLFMPNFIDLLFWTLIFYFIIRYINTSAARFIILLCLTAGAALLNKYLIGLLLVALLMVIPFTLLCEWALPAEARHPKKIRNPAIDTKIIIKSPPSLKLWRAKVGPAGLEPATP
jgi:4-amino-4-deoxy-L-arabinose transferase-like glycosyltransferase